MSGSSKLIHLHPHSTTLFLSPHISLILSFLVLSVSITLVILLRDLISTAFIPDLSFFVHVHVSLPYISVLIKIMSCNITFAFIDDFLFFVKGLSYFSSFNIFLTLTISGELATPIYILIHLLQAFISSLYHAWLSFIQFLHNCHVVFFTFIFKPFPSKIVNTQSIIPCKSSSLSTSITWSSAYISASIFCL
jgi:hypothetical protein